MPDLGERGYVMGPQPIAKVVVPPPAMIEATETLLNALIASDRKTVLAMTNADMVDEMTRIAEAIEPGAYAKFDLIGRARIAKHYFMKVRLTGKNSPPFIFQFRLGVEEKNGTERWIVREAMNLTGRRSAWSK